MLSAERSLELDESELFEEDQEQASPSVLEPASRLHSHAQAAQALSHGAPASTDGESESDDDGIVLESECSSSGGQLGEWERKAGSPQQHQWALHAAGPAGGYCPRGGNSSRHPLPIPLTSAFPVVFLFFFPVQMRGTMWRSLPAGYSRCSQA